MAIAISGGVLEPMFSPIGLCTLATSSGATPSSARAWMCGGSARGLPMIPTQRADVASASLQHHAEFLAVMIGHHDVGLAIGDRADARVHVEAVRVGLLGELGVGLDEHGPVAGVGGVPQQVLRDRRREDSDHHPAIDRGGHGAVRDLAGRVMFMIVSGMDVRIARGR